MQNLHKLPPLLEFPIEGQLDVILSSLELQPGLEEHQNVLLQTRWWGDNTPCNFRVDSSNGSAQLSFGVCCDDLSFRQYLLDAQKLVFTASIEAHIPNSYDNRLKSSFESEVGQHLSTKTAILTSPTKCVVKAESPARRLEMGLPVPPHLLGTPRHRLLEKKRTRWCPGDKVGECTLTNLKLNPRGELVHQCCVTNRFTDVVGSINVTMIYTHDLASLDDARDTSADCSSILHSELYDQMENKENVATANEWDNERSEGSKLPAILNKSKINYDSNNSRVSRTSQYANECQGNASINHSDFPPGTLLPAINSPLQNSGKLPMGSNITRDSTRPDFSNLTPHFTHTNARAPLQMNTLSSLNSPMSLQQGVPNISGQVTHITKDRLSSGHSASDPHSFVTLATQALTRLSLPLVSTSTNLHSVHNFAQETPNHDRPQGSFDQATVSKDFNFSRSPSLGHPPDLPHFPGFAAEDQFKAASDGNSHLVQHTLSEDSSDDTLSDESVVNYLRQLDPKALVECGALRIEDLSKFLKIIRDNTLDDIGETSLPHPTSGNVSSALTHPHSLMTRSAYIDPKVTAATFNSSTQPQSSSNTRPAHPSQILTGSSYQHVTRAQSTHQNEVTDSIYTGQALVPSTRHVAPPPKLSVSPTTSEWRKETSRGAAADSALPAVQREHSERSFSMRASEKRHSGGEQAEYSGISLPSGVWPLAPDHQNKDGTLLDRRKPTEQILHGIEQPNFKLPGYKYKAIGPDGKELVMDSDHLKMLTNSKYTIGNYHPIDSDSQFTTAKGERNIRKGHQLEKQRLSSKSVGTQNIHGKDKGCYDRPTTVIPNNNNDDDDSMSVASDETYTTSTINPNTDGIEKEEGTSSPGSLLVVEVGMLAVQGAAIADTAANKFNLKGVRDRSKVCLLTTLTVTLPSAGHPAGETALPLQDQQSSPARCQDTASGARLEEDGVMEGSSDPRRQSVTLASRRLQGDKVQYGSVEVFSLSGLTDPEHLQRASLEIRVYRRLLGQRESELLCGAQLSLWDVYRLLYGHVTIPLAPAHSTVTVTRHGAVDTTLAVVDTDWNDPHRCSASTKGRQVSPATKSPAKLLGVAQNVRSTRLGGDRPQRKEREPAAARRRSNERKPVSGEITLFLKLFLNELYIDELRHSIIEDPSVINSFISERDYPKIARDKGNTDDTLGVLTIPPNYSLSHTATLQGARRVNEGGAQNINPFLDIKESGCTWDRSSANVEVVDSILTTLPIGPLVSREGKQNVRKASRPDPFVPIVADIPQPTTKYSIVQHESRQNGFAGENRARLAPSITSCHWEQSNLPNGGHEGQQTIPPSNLSSHRSDSSRHTTELPESVHYNPSHLPHQLTSSEYKSSTPDLHFVQSSVNNPSVSFIQTLSQKFHQNNEYMIRIHIEILEARDLRLMSESVRPCGGQQLPETPSAYVRGTFFGTDVVTRVRHASSHPKWNFADDIVVSSSDVNTARACVVLRVYHQPDHLTATPSGLCSPPSHPLIGCLALRPPTPFWPGQVSLCGWYPLLDIRGRMAGHVKLSLTIVESLLNETCAVQYHQVTSGNTAEFVNPPPVSVSLQVNSNEVRNRIATPQDHALSHHQGLSLVMVDPEAGVMSQRSVSNSSRLSLKADSLHLTDPSSQFEREEAICSVGASSTGRPVPSNPQHISAYHPAQVTASTRELDASLLVSGQSRYNNAIRILPTNPYHSLSNSAAFAETAIREVAGTSVSSCVKSLIDTEHQSTNNSGRSTPQNREVHSNSGRYILQHSDIHTNSGESTLQHREVHTNSPSSRFLSNDNPMTEPLSCSGNRIPPPLLSYEDVPTRDTASFQEVSEILPPPPIYADHSSSPNGVVDVTMKSDIYHSPDPNLVECPIGQRDVFSPPDHLYAGTNFSSKVKDTATISVLNGIPLSRNLLTCDVPYEIPCGVETANTDKDIYLPDNSKEITSVNRRSKSNCLISYSQLYPNKMRKPFQSVPEAAFPSPPSSSNTAVLANGEHCSVMNSGSILCTSYGYDRTVGSNVEVTWTNCNSVSSLFESNSLAPTNTQVNSCLKVADTPRRFSKRVKFSDEPVNIHNEECSLKGSTESAIFVSSFEKKAEQLQHILKISEGIQVEDLDEVTTYVNDQPRYMNDIRNTGVSLSKFLPGRAKLSSEKISNYSLATVTCARVSSDVAGNLPEQEPLTTTHPSSVPVVRPDITHLLQTLSWMNLTKDSDSPCMSYIDSKKQCTEENTIRSGSVTVPSGVYERVSPQILNNDDGLLASRSRLADVALQAATTSDPSPRTEPQGVTVVSSDRHTEVPHAYNKNKATSCQTRTRIAANFSNRK